METTGILFVCLGNICRSPLGEGILRHLISQNGGSRRFLVDSAGTGGWHIGDPPDSRSIAVARRHGIDISAQRGRKIAAEDFQRFDLILAMDRNNLETLRAMAPLAARSRIKLFSDHALDQQKDVPDPYYGGAADFERVYNMLFEGCSSLLGRI